MSTIERKEIDKELLQKHTMVIDGIEFKPFINKVNDEILLEISEKTQDEAKKWITDRLEPNKKPPFIDPKHINKDNTVNFEAFFSSPDWKIEFECFLMCEIGDEKMGDVFTMLENFSNDYNGN